MQLVTIFLFTSAVSGTFLQSALATIDANKSDIDFIVRVAGNVSQQLAWQLVVGEPIPEAHVLLREDASGSSMLKNPTSKHYACLTDLSPLSMEFIPWLEGEEGQEAVSKMQHVVAQVPENLWNFKPSYSHYHLFLLEALDLVKEAQLLGEIRKSIKLESFIVKGLAGFSKILEYFPECQQLFTDLMPFYKQLYLEIANPGIIQQLARRINSDWYLHLNRKSVNRVTIFKRSAKGYEKFTSHSWNGLGEEGLVKWAADKLQIPCNSCPLSMAPLRYSEPFGPILRFQRHHLKAVCKILRFAGERGKTAINLHYATVSTRKAYLRLLKRYLKLPDEDTLRLYTILSPDRPLKTNVYFVKLELIKRVNSSTPPLQGKIVKIQRTINDYQAIIMLKLTFDNYNVKERAFRAEYKELAKAFEKMPTLLEIARIVLDGEGEINRYAELEMKATAFLARLGEHCRSLLRESKLSLLKTIKHGFDAELLLNKPLIAAIGSLSSSQRVSKRILMAALIAEGQENLWEAFSKRDKFDSTSAMLLFGDAVLQQLPEEYDGGGYEHVIAGNLIVSLIESNYQRS